MGLCIQQCVAELRSRQEELDKEKVLHCETQAALGESRRRCSEVEESREELEEKCFQIEQFFSSEDMKEVFSRGGGFSFLEVDELPMPAKESAQNSAPRLQRSSKPPTELTQCLDDAPFGTSSSAKEVAQPSITQSISGNLPSWLKW